MKLVDDNTNILNLSQADPRFEGNTRSRDKIPRDEGNTRDSLPTRTQVPQGLVDTSRLQTWGERKHESNPLHNSLQIQPKRSNVRTNDGKKDERCVIL